MEAEATAESLAGTMATAYRPEASRDGTIALVLGAGNVASIGPMHVVYKMFVEHQVVVLKMNPVNEDLGPFIERGFTPLVEGGSCASAAAAPTWARTSCTTPASTRSA